MVDINNLAVQPTSIKPGNPKQITFTWDGDVDKLSESPIEIELVIEDNAEVSFLDVTENLTKKVFWQTSDFEINTTPFKEILFLQNTASVFTGTDALITMNATNISGKTATSSCTIKF